MRRIFWCSTSTIAAVALLAGLLPLQAQEPARDDPYIASLARYKAADAKLADPNALPVGDELARTASDAITAAYFAERITEASQLFAKYRDLDLDPVAQVTGLGATMAITSDAAAREAASLRLAEIGAQPAGAAPLAPALSQAVLGAYAMGRDDLPGAIEFFRVAVELAQRDLAPDDPMQVMFSLQHARHLQFRDAEAGRAAVDRSEKLALAILPEDHPHWISIWWNMVERAQLAGRFDEAADLYARIADVAVREWGEDDPRMFTIIQNRAIALSQLGQWNEAIELARAAIALEGDRPAGDRAMHRAIIAGFFLGDGRTAESADLYREAMTIMEGMDPADFRWAFVGARLARAASMLGQGDEAVQMADLAAPIVAAKMQPDHPVRLINDGIIAKALARSGAPDRAFALLEASVAASETKLLDTFARTQEVQLIAGNNALFRDFAWVALKNGRMEEAWRAAQLATLSELALSSAQLSYPEDAAGFGAALDAVRAARREETAIRDQLAAGSATTAALSAAIDRRETAERDLDARYPDHAAFLRPSPTALAQAQAGLAADEAIVIPMIVEDRNATIILTREGVQWGETVSPFNSTTALISQLRNSLEEGSIAGGAFDAVAAHEIYRRFFPADLAGALSGKTRLIFPSGGPLAQIPASVLMSAPATDGAPGRYLIEDFAITVRSSLRPITRTARSQGQGFVGIGAPELAEASGTATSLRGLAIDPGDLRALPSLPGSLAELTAMRAAFASEPSLLLTGAQATEPQVRAAGLGNYRVLAFSTHGLVGGQIAQLGEPALVLTPPDAAVPGDDGLLTASEIAALDLNADWVILSACNTAAGNGRGSATYGGLARAFQLAGARSLLLSHWPVRDDAAAFLSVETLRRAEAGTDRAEALRAAQLALVRGQTGMAGETSPAVWAPFVLIEG